MKKYLLLLSVLLLWQGVPFYANTPEIITYIEANSKVKIHQSKEIDNIMHRYVADALEEARRGPYIGAGYRVQVFSSNDQQRGKIQSSQVEREMLGKFLEHNTYRTFSSPFWKVRVGDFRTMEDAQAFRNEMIRIFPHLSKEMYIVKEKRVVIRK